MLFELLETDSRENCCVSCFEDIYSGPVSETCHQVVSLLTERDVGSDVPLMQGDDAGTIL